MFACMTPTANCLLINAYDETEGKKSTRDKSSQGSRGSTISIYLRFRVADMEKWASDRES